ncbi:glycoside hydrolase family 9 protein [Hyphomicrobium sp.]|uniref:glycoside hydrolase family 9 protein n=1 Tax=Hyphomicrobium sp. TaxID=82 RepID=UPI001D6E0EAD|nr:glycoside hydrolase family 9 protein [Hyphomicrobium sp.]MBY0561311.1 glycoside hydrolase family 9 protein [Hyphomicrobium sp.]
MRSMRNLALCGSAFWIAISCIVISDASFAAARADQTQAATAASADKPSTDTSWREGLKSGANGPIPVIVVDQFGYPTQSTKVAVIRNPQTGYDIDASFKPGREYQVVDRSTGKIVKSGAPTPWNNGATDTVSGDQVWWFDFSDVKTPGTYAIVDTEHNQRSVEFEIDDHIYRRVLKHAVRMFFYQRAGFEKTEKTAGQSWADRASHLGPGQDPFTRSWLAKDDPSQEKDLRGGWYDAGDYNKYTSWAARNIISLLRAYDQNPAAFGDDFDIPESGNGIPDILDEAKWGLDWLERMQNADGSLLSVQSLADGSPPSAAKGPSFYGPPTTGATLMGAAVFAYASKVFSARAEPELKAYGADLAKRAKEAWTWASKNPSVLYYNNDDGKQPGSQGLAAGQQEMDDAHRLAARFEAAVYLFEITNDAEYAKLVEANFASIVPEWGPSQWDAVGQEALLYYARLPGASDSVKSAIIAKFATRMTQNGDQLPMVIGKNDPYRAPMKDFTWGSNFSKATQARLYELLASYAPDPNLAALAKSAGLGFLNYIHGVNPLGLVYLTNMKAAGAENSANTMYHSWFAYNSRRWSTVSGLNPGPAPGFLVGGPNPYYSLDPCCFAASGAPNFKCYMSGAFSLCRQGFSPPLGQPPAKSYLQFNDPWPANSWAVTEPSTGYQAAYILALAPYVN